METYELKEKISITDKFIKELEARSWQEINNLQNQIANIEAADENLVLIQLLKSLLTSYYVFIGGLENFSDNFSTADRAQAIEKIQPKEPTIENNIEEVTYVNSIKSEDAKVEQDAFEPFEYLVDFDDPIGDPLTDEDLYR